MGQRCDKSSSSECGSEANGHSCQSYDSYNICSGQFVAHLLVYWFTLQDCTSYSTSRNGYISEKL
jgi:hypothetical protein